MGGLRWEGVTAVPAAVALFVGRNPDQRTEELAAAFQVRPATMRGHLRLLEATGFIQRQGRRVSLAVPLEVLTERWGEL